MTRRLPHVLVAGALLVGLALWARADGQVSMDEGVAVVQARAIAHGSWAIPDPLAAADRNGAVFPLRDTTKTADGYVPFARHPAYPALLSLADRAAGTGGMVGVSILGTLGAALAAGALARRLDPRLEVPALYVTALGSPLLYDSTLVIAHSVGAACVGGAALALVRHREDGRTVSPWLVLAAAGTIGTVLLRGEGVLLGLAATAVVALVAALRRSRSLGVMAGALGAATGAAVVVDRVWQAAILGHGLALPGPPTEPVSWLHARIDALGTTALQVDYGGRTAALLLGAALLLLVTAVAVRRGGVRPDVVGAVAVAAGALGALWAVVASPSPVPGLLVAFPVLWFGLVVGRWTDVPLARVLALVAALFAVLVAATQYRQGGGYEWGARYVAIALPLAIPVALLGLVRAADATSDPRLRRTVGGALAVVTISLGAMGVATRREDGTNAARLGRAIIATAPASHLGPGDRDGRPVVMSAEFAVPQATSRVFDQARWLQVYDAGTRGVGDPWTFAQRLAADGLDRLTYVTKHADEASAALPGYVELSRRQVGAWTVLVLRPPAA